MAKLKFNIAMNAAVSVALSMVSLILLKQLPGIFNFVIPTIEGFAIAMFLTSFLPLDSWGKEIAKKIKLPEMAGALILIALVNVTSITFILNWQSHSLSQEAIIIWLKGLPVFYLTAIIVSMITAKWYLRKQKNN
ncbi:hypothetical protein ACVR0O_04685 [Streptococcus caviae]|uniref:hypothetical protein n=1 Tax=Streptococcus sp. 'caviae' TaxID=1915004 RepID=UPI00094B84A8|nr:hypothetical protein [Streptococcus sp. 'caviae']OLN84107.1 hypothetical protein BMI76_02605 [Streptococcus sp. 'caviae']